MIHYSLLIGGKKVDTGETYDVISPGTGEVIATVAKGSPAEVDAAVAAAEAAFENSGWRDTPMHERAAVIERAAAALEARGEEISMLSARENGTPVRLAQGLSVGFPVAHMRYYADLARKYVQDHPTMVAGTVVGMIRREPIGVVAGIVPWNFPLLLAVWKSIPAIAAGNSIVLKVDEKTPATGLILAELLRESGLPDGVFNIITGDGPEVGGYLTAHPRVRKVSFTGSTATGRTVMRNAADNVKQVTLELGGKGANIVLADADLDLAVDGSLWAFLVHAGQACESGTRLYVHKDIYGDFVKRLVARAEGLTVGDPTDPGTDIGPLMNCSQYDRVTGFVAGAIAAGATVAFQAPLPDSLHPDGQWVAPTVFTDVTADMSIATDEIFGPVVSVIEFDDVDAVIAAANASEYGLSAGVWTTDYARATEIANRLQAGTVWINDWHNLPGPLPFGGVKQSGFGREMGPHAIEEFTNEKSICIDYSGREARAAWGLMFS
ncbi:aldehyde dehydrogenase [Gordonia sp. TBRC 11910]|uniref:Aldehyde dehydrogenase n=1 Tax=Gordonia asplenii TaxID=2725283 RepID=A0A848L0L2_9ACTN|nr:aldehyde dehydrogenase family protein [Gordonia asplenii]NMO04346.1 aldehyde dehydrogenase [Gordonia asplenii]